MKKGIHPKYYKSAKILDNSSGVTFTMGATVENMTLEISSLTHPFYTGKQRIVDTDNLVEKFKERAKKAEANIGTIKKKKKIARKKSSVAKLEEKKAITLKDMLKQIKS